MEEEAPAGGAGAARRGGAALRPGGAARARRPGGGPPRGRDHRGGVPAQAPRAAASRQRSSSRPAARPGRLPKAVPSCAALVVLRPCVTCRVPPGPIHRAPPSERPWPCFSSRSSSTRCAAIAAEPLRPRALEGPRAQRAQGLVHGARLLAAARAPGEARGRQPRGRAAADRATRSRGIDAATFWTFLALGTGVKFVGILASMQRWRVLLRGQGIELPFAPHLRLVPDRPLHRHLPAEHRRPRRLHALRRRALQRQERRGHRGQVPGEDPRHHRDLPLVPGRAAGRHRDVPLDPRRGARRPRRRALHRALRRDRGRAARAALVPRPRACGCVEHLPLPGKARLSSVVHRISHSAAAYRHKKLLALLALGLSFVVHFTTAVLYYFTARAISAPGAEFWPIVLASSIQILATVLSPVTIAGEGIRELAQLVLLQNLIGAGPVDRVGRARLLGGRGAHARRRLVLVDAAGELHAEVVPRGRPPGRLRGGRARRGLASRTRRPARARRAAVVAPYAGARAARRGLRPRRRRDRRARARHRRGRRRGGRGLRQRGAGALVRAARLGRRARAARASRAGSCSPPSRWTNARRGAGRPRSPGS